MSQSLDFLHKHSSLSGANALFIEMMYEQYLKDHRSIDESWRQYFASFPPNDSPEIPHSPIQETFLHLAIKGRPRSPMECMAPEAAKKQAAVLRLINGYRVRGHQQAKTNPLCVDNDYCPNIPDLKLSYHGLDGIDCNTQFNTGSLVGKGQCSLKEILTKVNSVYCGSIGIEYMHITATDEKRWLQNRLEDTTAQAPLTDTEKLWILQQLTRSEGIETYLGKRYVGQKRFSIEGGESLIPLLDELIQRSGKYGCKEVIMGMAHRGRLNVLVNILGKSPASLFDEFEGKNKPQGEAGDVKYHQGFSSDIHTPGGNIHLALAFNPSHLEIINPVVQGSVRARQQRRRDITGRQVLAVQIHGDAAFAGQGVVMETLNMSQTRGYTTGGTVHLVINNQIGFTTSNTDDARSTMYCTDIAKMVQAPIFHVNGDDPEAVVLITRVALDYCKAFKKDVVIDLICYRRHGHNEADEPAVTQPKMYQRIKSHKTTRHLYADKLTAENLLTVAEVENMQNKLRDDLDAGFRVSREVIQDEEIIKYHFNWKDYIDADWTDECNTGFDLHELQRLSGLLLKTPEGFKLHARVLRIFTDRAKMAAGAMPMDWGFAENLAYATLLEEGYPVRLSGQDCGRGTFFHRHAKLLNQINGESYVPLQHLSEKQGHFLVINSLLSEEAVLGFEYGYATAEPYGLVIWEAQFGDFANGAQVVIDQFISSGEAKWQRLCGLVMLLPHGYEGQGPEHSSARLERYLQLCAGHNMQVCVPTSPAQIFHLIRRQVIRKYRRPLIVMSPKSLLRHKLAISDIDECVQGQFHEIIDEVDVLDVDKVSRLIVCCGKIYYDILEQRRHLGRSDIAIIRIEQLYPFPEVVFKQLLLKYNHLSTMVWCQEEPHNQGAWYQIQHRLRSCISSAITLQYTGRSNSASPATGSYRLHVQQQKSIVNDALGIK